MINTALFVLDVQRDYMNTGTPIEYKDTPSTLKIINKAIEQANHHNILVVYVVTQHNEKDWWKKWRKHMAATEGRTLLDRRLKIINDAVFTKKKKSALSNEKLAIYVREYNIRHIIVVGLLAETSIRSTALHAKKKGFHVTVVEDAIAGAYTANKQTVCTCFVQEGIIVCKLSEIFNTE